MSATTTKRVYRWTRWLCWLGLHRVGFGWCDDGKGNSGPFAECMRCGKYIEGYEDQP
jgi:hypothetical protein